MERRAEQWDIHKNKLIIEQEDGASHTPPWRVHQCDALLQQGGI